jgi:hypothetical protein
VTDDSNSKTDSLNEQARIKKNIIIESRLRELDRARKINRASKTPEGRKAIKLLEEVLNSLDAASAPQKTLTITKTESERHRLELNEGQKRFRIDDRWIDYRGDYPTFFLKVLLKKQGVWEQGRNLVLSPRSAPHKVLASLPEEIQEIIESQRGGTGGYRLKPEFFPTAGKLPNKHRIRPDTD